ncbi:hypothetical protein BX666DRAFT_1913955 [Dichotomocladium elegans]|nr:hypothetical protein BX666DRAFT_1913955 [Dichotomocladium elegans]
MEINRDEALRCLSIAKNHFGSGNYPAAVRFANKSLKLFPTEDARAFLEKAERASSEETTSGASTATAKDDGGATKRSTAGSAATGQSSSPSEKKYSKDQVAAVKKIMACGTDYYKVLSLDKNCTEVEIKKSYRKLALQFHPDKNNAPGADEAFKLISKAFTVLSDPQKRAIHDAGGGDPEMRGSGGGPGMGPGFQRFRTHQFGGMQDDISPEELFNMFFGGGMNGAFSPFGGGATFVGPGFTRQTYYRPGAGHRAGTAAAGAGAQRHRTNWAILLQILPLLVLFGYSILSGLFTDDTPSFSFQPSSTHSMGRTTYSHNVPYYVNPTRFTKTANDQYKLARLEQQVEIDWVRNLQHACQNERRERAARINAASGLFGIGRNEEQYQAAVRMPTKSCDEVRRFGYSPYQ